MKIPPKKPHFFKPILPDFNNGLKIPIGFLKYLKGQEHVKCAVLKRDGKKWRVKVNGRKLEEGNWGKFVKEFDLQVGNILVFSHEGSMEFEVSIFDSSQCSREYAEYMQEDVIEDVMEVDEEEDEEDEYVVEEEEEDEYEEEEDEVEEEEEEEVVTDDNSCERSYFEYTITPYCLSFRACLFLPQQFALANDLTNKKCKLIIRDERQRSWKLKICSSSNPRPRAYIGSGWRKFIAENSIKEGDRIKFEVVTNGKTPIWKFQVDTDYQTPMRNLNIDLSNKTSSHAEAASTNKAFVQSHFECTIRPYCFLRGTLNVPKQFAIANGLTNKKCELIVRDERQRSWNLKLSSGSTRSYIGDGFRKFIADNCLKEGDDIMFEVITNGETPIWKFKVVTGGETAVRNPDFVLSHKRRNLNKEITSWNRETTGRLEAQRERMLLSPNIDLPNMTSSHAEADTNKPFVRSHFVCTITQKMFSRGLLYVPKKFAIANGLTNKKCGLIVRDERQRSWNLKLSFGGTQAQPYIGYGLRKLIAENCTKEGDRIKFEVVTNGKTPIWKFQTSSHAEAATNKPFVQSHFECTIREYCLSRGLLYLPKQFAFANCLINKKHDLIIRDERQKSWNLKLCYCQTDVYIGDGWRKFVADNCLKEGDRIMFEVVTSGETPVWEFRVNEAKTPLQKYQGKFLMFQNISFYIMKKPSNTSPLNAQVSTSTSGDDDHPYFISTIKRYCIRKTELYFPLDFAKSNGLNRKCEMILKDETERCWSVWLGRLGTHFGITRGWTKFRTENGLQVGDAYKFELIKNGEIPIAHFHCKFSFNSNVFLSRLSSMFDSIHKYHY
ncbi:hypothetical protein FXO38_26878 [Capsicum annuum]|nr:hypothetical protein FXO38_26878 [Capsicum annuum]